MPTQRFLKVAARSFERLPSPARREPEQRENQGKSDSAVAGQVNGFVSQELLCRA